MGQYGLFDMSSETIMDEHTGLTWQRSTPTLTMKFYEAQSYCASLSLPTLTGTTTGWRVPSYKELLTLVDEVPHTEYVGDGFVQVWIDANAFDSPPYFQTTAGGYWTSSMYASSSAEAYIVDFSAGGGNDAPTTTALSVRCVHDPG